MAGLHEEGDRRAAGEGRRRRQGANAAVAASNAAIEGYNAAVKEFQAQAEAAR